VTRTDEEVIATGAESRPLLTKGADDGSTSGYGASPAGADEDAQSPDGEVAAGCDPSIPDDAAAELSRRRPHRGNLIVLGIWPLQIVIGPHIQGMLTTWAGQDPMGICCPLSLASAAVCMVCALKSQTHTPCFKCERTSVRAELAGLLALVSRCTASSRPRPRWLVG